MKLASGRIIRHARMANGAQSATPTTGPDAMTSAEWNEYADRIIEGVRERTRARDAARKLERAALAGGAA